MTTETKENNENLQQNVKENVANTNDEKVRLQWHPAFYAGLQIEFAGEADKLIFEREHNLSTKPMQIDVLIIKKRADEAIHKNIGRIFRRYNIIEYKSPTDYLSIDDYYKVYGYTCFYKSSSKHVNDIKVMDLTITFVCKNYPKEFANHLVKIQGFHIEKISEGIYYINRDIIPMQLIVTSELSEEENLWLKNLTDDLRSASSIEKLSHEYNRCCKATAIRYGKHVDEELYKSVMNIIIRANKEKFKEVDDMLEALEELFADELEMSRNEGRQEGQREGRLQGIRDIVQNMLRKGMDIIDICELAECSEEYVEEVRRTL